MALKEIKVPDLGGSSDVDVIELMVKPGDKVEKGASLITLEGDKASMEVPSPGAGIVKEFKIKVGDKVSEGAVILLMEAGTANTEPAQKPEAAKETKETKETKEAEKKEESQEKITAAAETRIPKSEIAEAYSSDKSISEGEEVHAGPAVRRLAREFGIELKRITPSGEKGRILKQDIQSYVKTSLRNQTAGMGIGGLAVAAAPKIDFSKFGEVEIKPLSKIKKLTGVNTHRSWVTVPHVTQFDEADITELEEFRRAKKDEAEKKGYKLTPLVFLMKAVVKCLQAYPEFNSSLDGTGENLILKKYFNMGVAADTPNGLVVPVIRDVDKKGLFELSKELADISKKAREKGLTVNEMSGSCFTISSLGGIGGTAFTPIVNAPDVAILGVSKSQMKPVWNGKEFVPRLMLPLSLSYDHRVIDGAGAARFITLLSSFLGDIRDLLL